MQEDGVVGRGLISRATKGDAWALARLYDEYAGTLHAVAYRITTCPSDADDVVHDLFAGLPRALGTYQGRGSLGGWLKRCTVRLALMRLRKVRREVRFDPSAHAAADSRARDPTVGAALTHALKRLPPDLRAVVVLKDVEGYSHTEIGELLDISAGNSAVRLHRARRQLRNLLRDS